MLGTGLFLKKIYTIVYGWSGICIFHKMKRKRKKKRTRTRWRLSTKREMSVIWLFFSMKRDSFYVFIWEKWFLVIVIRVVVFFFIHILLRDSEWWIQISHSVKLWWEMRPYTILWSIRISYRIHDFRFFWNRGHHMIPVWLDYFYFRVCDHGCQDEIQRHGNMYPLILEIIWTCSRYP